MVLSSQTHELTAFSMPQFYFKPNSFLDAVYEILTFKKNIHTVAKESENVYIGSTQSSNIDLALKGQAAHENWHMPQKT